MLAQRNVGKRKKIAYTIVIFKTSSINLSRIYITTNVKVWKANKERQVLISEVIFQRLKINTTILSHVENSKSSKNNIYVIVLNKPVFFWTISTANLEKCKEI